MKRAIAFLCFFLVSGWLSSYADNVPDGQVVPRQAAKGVRTDAKTLPGEVQAVKNADEPQKQERTEIKNGSRPRPTSPERKRAPRASGPISLNFDDADTYQVIQTVFGEILRVNYVVDQRVKGRVTFRSVTPVAADRVLAVMEVILRLNGMGVVEESGLYRIVPIGDVSREPAEVALGRDPDSMVIEGKSIIQVVPVMYSQSAEVIKLLAPFITASAVVVEVPKINHIIIVDTDANVKRLLKLVNLFDSERTKQKRPQIFVYHVQNNKAKDIASILQQVFISSGHSGAAAPSIIAPSSPGGKTTASKQAPAPVARAAAVENTGGASASGGSPARDAIISPSTKIIAEENLNSIIVLATPEDYEVIKEAIERIDIIPRQVVIEGVIAEITLKDDLKLGVSWALQFKPDGMNGVLSAVDGAVGFNMPGATTTSTTGTGTFTFAGTVGSDFKAVIDMLATQSKAKLLAVPHILVSDNKEARIQVGEQVPIVTSETFASTTVSPQRTIQYKDIGIILKVKPRINEGGLVSLDLAQEVSSYDTITLFDGETNIIVKKTETTTNLVVQDGQTILIGGLIREDVSSARSGIPYLSKIPLLGYLFGNTTDENHRKELIILLTPRVIKTRKDALKTTSDYIDDITRTGKGKLRKEELIRGVDPAGKNKNGKAGGKKSDEMAKSAGPNGQVKAKEPPPEKNAQAAKGHETAHSEIFEAP